MVLTTRELGTRNIQEVDAKMRVSGGKPCPATIASWLDELFKNVLKSYVMGTLTTFWELLSMIGSGRPLRRVLTSMRC